MNDRLWVWLKAAGIRAIKTMAQTAVSMLGGDMIGILDAQWISVASVAAMAGVLSILTSVAGLPEVKDENGNGIPDDME